MENRFNNIPLYETVPKFLMKLYLVVFELEIDGKVEKFIKVGTTSYKDILIDLYVITKHFIKDGMLGLKLVCTYTLIR